MLSRRVRCTARADAGPAEPEHHHDEDHFVKILMSEWELVGVGVAICRQESKQNFLLALDDERCVQHE